jgi:hypothetical protein
MIHQKILHIILPKPMKKRLFEEKTVCELPKMSREE